MGKRRLFCGKNPFLSLPGVLLLYGVSLLCVIFRIHGVCVIYGIPMEQFENGLDSLVFGKWMFMMTVPLLVSGRIFENGRRIQIYCELRMKRKSRFYLWLTGISAAVTVLWAAVLVLAVCMTDGFDSPFVLFLLLASSFLMWDMWWQLFLRKMPATVYAAAVILAVLGGSCLFGGYFPQFLVFQPSAWGMYTLAAWDGIGKMAVRNLLAAAAAAVIQITDNKE